ATPWAPPTAEQIGLIGTHWSKGWIIERNTTSHSVCSGIALGKHGDEFDNTSANSAEGYVKTIERAHAHAIAWAKENIGHHIVRNNTVSHCEQAGIVGSLGCSFSTVTGNIIHDIHVRRLFTGAEMAGIKFHGAIDTKISRNHIYCTTRGLWLDWMAQGTRVTRNLFHDNDREDLFVEVNHGPFVVDNNIFLSATTLLDVSEGGAYAHNLIAGKLISQPEPRRDTPYHPAHSTKVAGLVNTKGGDNRFYNNIFVGGTETPAQAPKGKKSAPRTAGFGLWVYDNREFPLQTGGNVYLNGARPYAKEANPLTLSEAFDCKLVEEAGSVNLHLTLPASLSKAATELVMTALLGKAKIPGVRYENPNGSLLKVDSDYFGKRRNKTNPTAGPFENPGTGPLTITVW
ncbi:MAG: right-handed parallel beta-helix repeat-containing protein, partial [Verrucomicrobia bacterium]|nr:right-handed parallel beta-helix repeat-containing protein [Verrucomicrobiota bacterium]